ncbi:MAG: exosortase A [Thermodesulfobacteriota bacterium]
MKSAYTKLLLVGASVLLLYHPVLSYLVVNWWNDPNYSHGFIVPLVSLYVVWKRRDELSSLDPAPTSLGAVVLAGGVLMLALGHVGAELFLMRLSLLVVIAGLILFLAGPVHLRMTAFAIGFLVLMIPLPMVVFNAVAFPLQMLAAKVATVVISALGIPVLREGNVIQLSHVTLEVAEACSGIRSLVTIITIAVIYTYFTMDRRWKQFVLVAMSVPIAILVNSARVTGTAVLAQYFGARLFEDFYHAFEGWFMFLVSLALLLAVDAALRRVWR